MAWRDTGRVAQTSPHCSKQGNLACDLSTPADGNDTFCSDPSGNEVVVGTAGSEATNPGCNNLDDDCDGDVDEACGLGTTSGTCVTDNWVQIPKCSCPCLFF